MDIIDVLVARALTPQGQIDTYAAKARQAILDANTAVTTVEDAADNITDLTAQTTENNATAQASAAAANQALADASTTLELANDALARIDEATIASLDTEINKLTLSLTANTNSASTSYDLVTTYPDGLVRTLNNIVKYYSYFGNNTDGTMTQKAISDAFEQVYQMIETGSFNFESQYAGHIPVINAEGYLVPSQITESDLSILLAKNEIYELESTVGITIDYEARTITRVHESKNYQAGSSFDKYNMYGGRKKCIVDNEGNIVAWYGDANYTEDGSLGDVMIYQPKFYYQRAIIKSEDGTVGQIVRKETLSLSDKPQPGFKLHPAFIDSYNNELEYILLPAYEGCYYDTSEGHIVTDASGTIDFYSGTTSDVLRSCANVKPITGLNNVLDIHNAQQLAANHGNNWYLTDIKAESANQMLMMVEYATLNGQAALESGLSNLPNYDSYNCASQTGSTSDLGDSSGIAPSTTNITNGVTNIYDTAGRRAIAYRGMENPWGNTWRFVNGIKIVGDGQSQGGVPYVALYRYTAIDAESTQWMPAGFCLPATTGWISAMGYGNESCDWLYMPAETNNGNSAVPVGDQIWVSNNFNGTHAVQIGGSWQQQANNGLFHYACDNDVDRYSRTLNARLMYIPDPNSTVYTNNLTAWEEIMDGGMK